METPQPVEADFRLVFCVKVVPVKSHFSFTLLHYNGEKMNVLWEMMHHFSLMNSRFFSQNTISWLSNICSALPAS
jgi:hypothetical protein